MIYLLLSIVALIAGPLVFAAASRRPAAREGLEGFILITLAGIVCLHIAPEAWRVAGIASLATGLLGLAFPALLEGMFRKALSRAHLVVLAVAAAGIVVHAVLDGIALLPLVTVSDAEQGSRALAIGVIIHRLPVGMAIWWVLRPQFGTAVAVTTFLVVIVTTVFGYLLGGELLASTAWTLSLFQAFVAGSLVHVALFGVSHDHDHDHEHPDGPGAMDVASAVLPRNFQSRAYRAGLLLGLVTIFILPHISS
jgi:hypothetical protein